MSDNLTLTSFLNEFGFTDNETIVYLTLLQIGTSSILDVSKECELKRPTIYSAIDSLIEKGLIRKTVIGKRKRFTAKSPNVLESIHNRRGDEMSSLILQLKALENVPRGTKPVIRLYEGENSVANLFRSITSTMDQGATLYAAVSMQDMNQRFPKLQESFNTISKKSNWPIQELLPNNQSSKDYITKHKTSFSLNPNHEYKLLPLGLELFDMNYMIVNDTVIMLSFNEDVLATVIESKNTALSMATLFKTAWLSSTPYSGTFHVEH